VFRINPAVAPFGARNGAWQNPTQLFAAGGEGNFSACEAFALALGCGQGLTA